MSFGWSIGDVIAGMKVVFDIWQAVSDGPLNARFEAGQFFAEFIHVVSRLDAWESRKDLCAQDALLKQSHEELREQCTLFIKKHMAIIQKANPNTKAIRSRRSTWIRRAMFTQDQVNVLYQLVSWPMERKTVKGLREKLQFFLNLAVYEVGLAAYDVGQHTNSIVREIRQSTNSQADMASSNHRLLTSHLDLVSPIIINLTRQAREINYPILRQFEHALEPPRPIRAIENTHRGSELPWENQRRLEEAQYATLPPPALSIQETGRFEQDEVRDLMTQRLDNLAMRARPVGTMDTISESGSQAPDPSVQKLLNRLQDMRGQIAEAIGAVIHVPPSNGAVTVIEPKLAILEELEAWNLLEERLQRDRLHPPAGMVQPPTPPTRPIPIPSPRNSYSLSPVVSPHDGWTGSSSGSPDPNRQYFSSSPTHPRPLSKSRTLSTSSVSRPESVILESQLRVQLSYLNFSSIRAIVHSISRFDNGDVESITSLSQDGQVTFRHSLDLKSAASVEPSMTPFLDNAHVHKAHKFRVQFKGPHTFTITNQREKLATIALPPVYEFYNRDDFLKFQGLLLNKTVVYTADVQSIKSSDSDFQCRLGTIRILCEAFSQTRHILYFKHTSDQKQGFVEWPVNLCNEPKEPTRKAKSVTMNSADGKALQVSRGLSRRSTQGSLATINSFETSAGPAHTRIESRSGKTIKGLVVEFYDADECHAFWQEFTKTQVVGFDVGLGLKLPAELAA